MERCHSCARPSTRAYHLTSGELLLGSDSSQNSGVVGRLQLHKDAFLLCDLLLQLKLRGGADEFLSAGFC